MKTKNMVIGVVIGVLLIVGPLGAQAGVDKLNGPDTPEVSIERLNSTHAAVAWTAEEPADGRLVTYVQPACDSSWVAVNAVNDSSEQRMHHVAAPIYDLNETETNRTLSNLSGEYEFEYEGEQPKRFKVVASVQNGGSGARQTIVHRNLSHSC